MLKTVGEIIEALGGSAEAARLANVGPSAVSNWKTRGRIPAEQYSIFADALERAGKVADATLFGMRPVTSESEVRT